MLNEYASFKFKYSILLMGGKTNKASLFKFSFQFNMHDSNN